jgi:hypothetical protein
MAAFKKGQLWQADYPFEDDPLRSKIRPVVILNVYQNTKEVLAMKVTSHVPRSYDKFDYALKDWRDEGLSKPSTAQCCKFQYLKFSDIYTERGMYGALTHRDYDTVCQLVKSFSIQIRQAVTKPEYYNKSQYNELKNTGFYMSINNSNLIDAMKEQHLNFCYVKKDNTYSCVISNADHQKFNLIINSLAPRPYLTR